ncbi:MAG: hypothetical protein HZC23_02495 [Rhodocyclales bacterium]|nr:hypothetical protein [Rhodocyclales bacterium]
MKPTMQKPTGAFVGASWIALMVGTLGFITGLWNAEMQLNEKGYYFTVLILGLFSSVSLQKAVRDRLEGVPVTGLYFSLAWIAVGASITLLVIGLWNASFTQSEKGFYAIAYLMSLYAAVAVQKNVRDLALFKEEDMAHEQEPAPDAKT